MAMSILEHFKKINLSGISLHANPATWPETLTTSLIIVLVAFGSFGLGRLSRIEESKAPLQIKGIGGAEAQVSGVSSGANIGTSIKGTVQKTAEINKIAVPQEGFIVGSKTGKKYHFPWCAGAQQIKEENKVWFANEVEAKAAGYSPATNCKGLPQ